MKKAVNSCKIAGYLYDHNLKVKQVKNTASANFGKNFISGSVFIATDEDCVNSVEVHYTYIPESNSNYTLLSSIIENNPTVINLGKENALAVNCTSVTVETNDFYNRDDQLVSVKRNEGGFIREQTYKPIKFQNSFETDILINGTMMREPEEGEPYLVVKGAVFNFRNAIMPVEFIVRDKSGINYFESLEASPTNLVFTNVRGDIVSTTVVHKREEVGAFGEPKITESTRHEREWVINWASSEIYDISENASDSGITPDEIKSCMVVRETHLADVKARSDEYKASQNAMNTSSNSGGGMAAAAYGSFNF